MGAGLWICGLSGQPSAAGLDRAARWAVLLGSSLPLLYACPLNGQPPSAASSNVRTDDGPPGSTVPPLPALSDVLTASHDLWGQAALQQPDGPSYEFFERLLPPPRYVHADFRYYPLVLSAPRAAVKARLISNGSGVNLRGGSRSWKDAACGVVFRVGPDEIRFGELADRLSEPQPMDGWLPIYTVTYRHPSPLPTGSLSLDGTQPKPLPEVYVLEAFATTQPPWSDEAVIFCRFSLAQGGQGHISVQLESPSEGRFVEGNLCDAQGRLIVWLGPAWRWERNAAHARLAADRAAVLAIFTRPAARQLPPLDERDYARHRQATEASWRQWLARAANVEVPEPRVQNAWRHLLVQNLMLVRDRTMLYSAGNQYESFYAAEGSDAIIAMLHWGYEDLARELIEPLLAFTRRGLEHHQAAHKLQTVIRYYWQTRDVATLATWRPRWQPELDRLRHGRDPVTGLLPRERYCGDVATPVHSLAVEAKAWRALWESSHLLHALGRSEEADALRQEAATLRKRLLEAVRRNARHETAPPFIPMALDAQEAIHDPITATRLGSYWNLISNYVIGARLFPADTPEADWLPGYLESHGGLCMGMTRAGGFEQTFWTGPHRVNPLYGTRYVLELLRRDEVEPALVSFYGMLAQGMTRQTFVTGEGYALAPMDPGGRFFYCPPNSAANAHFLMMLKHLLVQEDDTDDDGRPDTLRLLAATPRRWLADGQSITVRRMPTAFGPVSWSARSRLADRQVDVTVEGPLRERPQRLLLRARVPTAWRVVAASVEGQPRPVDAAGTVDLSDGQGTQHVLFQVVPAP